MRTRIAFLCATLAVLASASLSRAQVSSATINDFANNADGYGGLQYGLMQASDGNFYMLGGGATNVIRVVPNSGDTAGTISTLAGQLPSACGTDVHGNLIEASDGNLYGLTSSGAANGYGTFFKYVLSTRTCTPVYVFNPSVDGSGSSNEDGGLTYGSDGNFYGMWKYGGANSSGSAFQITPSGTYNTLYSFCSGGTGCPDGSTPTGYLIEASNGNWYGITLSGGSGANLGVLFELTPGLTFPWVETPLFNMSATSGYHQVGWIVEGNDSNLYGSMLSGGANDGDGDIFQSDLQGDYVDFYDNGVLYQEPQTLQVGGDNNLYGTNLAYQCNCGGDLYQLTLAGTWTNLATFTTASPALYDPEGQIIQGSDGNFYGTAYFGGTKTYGGVFQAVPNQAVAAPIQVTLSANTSNGSPITVSYKVLNDNSKTAGNCYLYTQAGGGTFTGKATGTVTSGVLNGSVSVTPTATGTYTYAVECAGTYVGISPTLTVTGISAAPTKTVLTASPNPANVGGNVTLTATVTRTSGSGTPGGTVSFEFHGQVLATKTLSNGTASYTASTTGIDPGTYAVYAVYNPDSQDAGSTSNTVNVVLKYATTTTLSVSPNPVTEPNNVTLTVHVTSASGTPGGTVTIYAGGNPVISNFALSSGTAVITASTNGFPKGTYAVTAGYNGSATYNTSTSSATNVTLQ